MLKEVLLVGAGGFAGSVCRYLVGTAMASLSWLGPIPAGTLTVNFAGSLLIGFFMTLSGQHWLIYLGIAGFCGGFTTFSTFSAETLAMIRTSQWGPAVLYVALSVIVCIAAVALGLWIGEKIIVKA